MMRISAKRITLSSQGSKDQFNRYISSKGNRQWKIPGRGTLMLK